MSQRSVRAAATTFLNGFPGNSHHVLAAPDGSGGYRLKASSAFVGICPADDARSIATIEAAVPSFTKAPVTFGTITLRLCPASENVFAYPAIYPFALINKILAAFASLAGFRYGNSLRDIAHFAPSSGTAHAGGSYFGLVVNSITTEAGQRGLGRSKGG